MTTFNIRPDDAGIRNLRNENLKPHTTKQVGAISPYPEVHPAKIGFHDAVEQEVRSLRQQGQTPSEQELIVAEREEEQDRERRRRNDRRQHQAPVLLDTRAGSERRQLENNPQTELSDNEQKEHLGLGVDLYT